MEFEFCMTKNFLGQAEEKKQEVPADLTTRRRCADTGIHYAWARVTVADRFLAVFLTAAGRTEVARTEIAAIVYWKREKRHYVKTQEYL